MSCEGDFEALFRRGYAQFYYFAIGLVKDEEVARDVVGRAFEQLWNNITQVSPDKWAAYVHRTIHHLCVDQLRSKMSHKRYEAFYKSLYGDGLTDDDEIQKENEAAIQQIEKLMDDLTPQTRRILEECYFRRKRYADVAGELGISVSAVRKHIVKALKYFRDNMQETQKMIKRR